MKNKFLVIISTLLFPLPLWAAFYDYTPMESLPGFAKTGDFYQLLQDLYKFGVWLAIISAFFMLVVGGYMYLVSAGNKSTVDEAKKIISNALVGLVCALIAWLLLYTLNPDLVKINKLSMQETGSNTTTGGSTTGGETTGDKNCAGGRCTQIDRACQNNSSGIDPALLKSILVGGESCDSRTSDDGFGSCGYSQALPKIRAWCGISGTNIETCTKIKKDVQLDINCAAKLIKSNAGRCGLTPRGAASCYNSGVANNCPNTTRDYCGRVEKYYNNCASASASN